MTQRSAKDAAKECQGSLGLFEELAIVQDPEPEFDVPTFAELLALSESLLEELCVKHPMSIQPRLIWKNLRVSAGIAKYQKSTIILSKLLCTDEERMASTLKHEFAHLLAVARHGRKAVGHGKWWREAMRELGEEPTVRHCYEVARNAARQEVGYRCKRCGGLVKRSRRLPRGRRYLHVPCGGPLKLEYVKAVNSLQDEG